MAKGTRGGAYESEAPTLTPRQQEEEGVAGTQSCTGYTEGAWEGPS